VAIYGRKMDFKSVLNSTTRVPQGAQNFLSTVRKDFREVSGKSH